MNQQYSPLPGIFLSVSQDQRAVQAVNPRTPDGEKPHQNTLEYSLLHHSVSWLQGKRHCIYKLHHLNHHSIKASCPQTH